MKQIFAQIGWLPCYCVILYYFVVVKLPLTHNIHFDLLSENSKTLSAKGCPDGQASHMKVDMILKLRYMLDDLSEIHIPHHKT